MSPPPEASSLLATHDLRRTAHIKLQEVFAAGVVEAANQFGNSIHLDHLMLQFNRRVELIPFDSTRDKWWQERKLLGRPSEFGIVYAVMHCGRQFAAKEVRRVTTGQLLPGMQPDETTEEAAYRECGTLLMLTVIGNSSTVKISGAFADVSCTPWKFYIGMEYITGRTFEDACASLTPEQRLLAAAELGFLLEYLQAYKIFHNDLHERNLTIRDDGRIVLIDYGAISVGRQAREGFSDLRDYRAIVNSLFDDVPPLLVPPCVLDLKDMDGKLRDFTAIGDCLRSVFGAPHFSVRYSILPGALGYVPKIVVPTASPVNNGTRTNDRLQAFAIPALWDQFQLAPIAFRYTLDLYLCALSQGGDCLNLVLLWLGERVQEISQQKQSEKLRNGLSSARTAALPASLCVSALLEIAEIANYKPLRSHEWKTSKRRLLKDLNGASLSFTRSFLSLKDRLFFHLSLNSL